MQGSGCPAILSSRHLAKVPWIAARTNATLVIQLRARRQRRDQDRPHETMDGVKPSANGNDPVTRGHQGSDPDPATGNRVDSDPPANMARERLLHAMSLSLWLPRLRQP